MIIFLCTMKFPSSNVMASKYKVFRLPRFCDVNQNYMNNYMAPVQSRFAKDPPFACKGTVLSWLCNIWESGAIFHSAMILGGALEMELQSIHPALQIKPFY